MQVMFAMYRLPHVGQNLWFYLDCVDDIRSLCENLHPRGVRESVLKDELQKHLDAIFKSVSSISTRYVIMARVEIARVTYRLHSRQQISHVV